MASTSNILIETFSNKLLAASVPHLNSLSNYKPVQDANLNGCRCFDAPAETAIQPVDALLSSGITIVLIFFSIALLFAFTAFFIRVSMANRWFGLSAPSSNALSPGVLDSKRLSRWFKRLIRLLIPLAPALAFYYYIPRQQIPPFLIRLVAHAITGHFLGSWGSSVTQYTFHSWNAYLPLWSKILMVGLAAFSTLATIHSCVYYCILIPFRCLDWIRIQITRRLPCGWLPVCVLGLLGIRPLWAYLSVLLEFLSATVISAHRFRDLMDLSPAVNVMSVAIAAVLYVYLYFGEVRLLLLLCPVLNDLSSDFLLIVIPPIFLLSLHGLAFLSPYG
ncbi:hypothetical protein C8R43DRAFT_680701 [Mycena crocata]|nr:hypothetical protein C8R43DRAFT_680701 [Mycena crocata]